MKKTLSIFWFEQDLRLSDNPALTAAVNQGNVLPIYIIDPDNAGKQHLGAASRWWLHHSLQALNESLAGKLNLYQGNAINIIDDLCRRFAITGVYWNRRYEPWRISREKIIKQQLLSQGVHAESYNGSLLHEPWTILKKDATPYKVFTPYHRKASIINTNPASLPAPKLLPLLHVDKQAVKLQSLSLLPKKSWDNDFYDCWTPGETGANLSLNTFLLNGMSHYRDGRDFPALKAISTLSPHLHFGEISPLQITDALLSLPDSDNREHFRREIDWREFSYYLLFHWPNLPNDNLKTNFDAFPWENNPQWLASWQQGLTGYPLVDAGMRELWKTGFMHNRIRMITASFLIKNLLIDWRIGASWFWDCLVDADLASNSASWQWVAGCGTDASPYFRIFNPITQGEKFDAEGIYTKHHLPELKDLPNKYLFRPWEAPPEILEKANVILGKTYPLPIVDIKVSRQKALDAYKTSKSSLQQVIP
jgi:deoxyribodipyrimidine photo-lyase